MNDNTPEWYLLLNNPNLQNLVRELSGFKQKLGVGLVLLAAANLTGPGSRYSDSNALIFDLDHLISLGIA